MGDGRKQCGQAGRKRLRWSLRSDLNTCRQLARGLAIADVVAAAAVAALAQALDVERYLRIIGAHSVYLKTELVHWIEGIELC